MYEELRQRKKECEEQLVKIAKQEDKLKEELKKIAEREYKLKQKLESTSKELQEKEKEIYDILEQLEKKQLEKKQRKLEKAEEDMKETEKKKENLYKVLSSKLFYRRVRKSFSKYNWEKMNEAILSDEFATFVLKNSYANRVIKAFNGDGELSPAIMNAMVSKLEKLIK